MEGAAVTVTASSREELLQLIMRGQAAVRCVRMGGTPCCVLNALPASTASVRSRIPSGQAVHMPSRRSCPATRPSRCSSTAAVQSRV